MYSKFARCTLLVAFLLSFVFCPSLAMAVDVPKWSVYDIDLTATGGSSNWYTDPDGAVTATFTGPGGITETVSGFWNGGNAFDIRFTPTAEGTWTYTTRSANSGLNNQTGTINAVAAEAGNHGFLRIDPTYKSSFVWDDGTRSFLWGQTYYDLATTAMVNDHWKAGIDNSAAYGMTKVRMAVYPFALGSTRSHGYPDVQPYAGSSTSPNRNVLNIAYWQELDEVVKYIASKGMVADLILTSPYSSNRQFGTDTQNDRFLNYVVNRYSAYRNVTWCLANEWNYSATNGGTYPQDQNDFNRMGEIVHNGDPWLANGAALRPLSTHQRTRIDFNFFGAAWPTDAIVQYGPRNPGASPAGTPKSTHGDQWGNAGIVYNLGHNMPVVNDEYAYLNEVNGGVTVTQATCRLTSWGIATAGGYGSASDWSIHTNWTPGVTGEWSYEPMYDDIKHMVDFFTTKGIEYWKMASHNELKTSGTRTYVLAEPGRQYVAYLATGGTFALSLPAGEYYAYRYNPRTGETTPLPNVTGGGAASFTMPDSNDWVVHLSTFQEVPEPGALGLLGLGAAVLSVGMVARSRQRVRRP